MAHLDLLSDRQKSNQFRLGRRIYQRIGKRTLDLGLALVLLPFLLPVIAAMILAIRLQGGPAFYAHMRVGQHGKRFTCWKIRTMVGDAEDRLANHLQTNADAAEEWQRTQKLQSDPRVTSLGRHLRRTSLDELPQIWNVLRGEMSLVGPRPVTVPELERYGPHKHIYLSLKPGVTGLWQVFGRSNGCYEQRLRMDRAYSKKVGLWQDLSLIGRTALVVTRGTGC